MVKYNVIIVEDEKCSAEVMIEFVSMKVELTLAYYANTPERALNYFRDNNDKIDLILLDIRMPEMTGFEFIEKLDEVPFVIFTTAFDHYAVKAFELDALDYMVKPISYDRFSKAIDKFLYYKRNSIPYDIYGALEELKGKDKYKKSILSEKDLKEYSKKLADYMSNSEPYLDIEFNLHTISHNLNISQHYISQVLSIVYETNFYKYVSSYRIIYAKRLLEKNSNMSILEISLLSGFQSRSVFNQAFKTMTGVTPKQYRENFML